MRRWARSFAPATVGDHSECLRLREVFLNSAALATEENRDAVRCDQHGCGVGVDTTAEMLIIFGADPDRIRSEAAFAKLCGACRIPASS